jgi:hypothetical protein
MRLSTASIFVATLLAGLGLSTASPAQRRPPETYRVTPAVECVTAEDLNGLVFLHNGCDQEVRAYWCVDPVTTDDELIAPASCSSLSAAETKPSVEIEAQQSSALVVPTLGGNLEVPRVREVHVAACPLRTRDINVPHHFELTYSADSVQTKCLQKAAVKPGQRTQLVDLQLAPELAPVRLRLVDWPR